MDSEPAVRGVSPRYRLGELLGTGGMAEVLAADDLLLHRGVAVKRLRAEFARSPHARSRFAAEARAAARLSHPNIVAVFDIGEADGNPFIVMERLPGGSLADLLAGGPLSEGEALRIVGQVLAALSAAHAVGIVHGDVKPANVLLGEDGTAKVADFGTAQSGEPAGDGQGPTAPDVILGTPAYLAPERAEGAPATPASDVFSVGVLLYEALTGVLPFPGADPSAMADAARKGRFAPLEARRPDVSRAVSRAVGRALSADRSARFDTAESMAVALGVAPPGALGRSTTRLAAVSGPPTQVIERRTARVAAVTSAGPGRGRPSRLSWRTLGIVAAGLLAFVLAAGLAVGLSSGPSTAGHRADGSSTARIRPRTDTTTAPTTSPSTTSTTLPSAPTAVLADNPAPAPTTTTTTAPTPTTTTPPTPTTTAPTPPGNPPSGAAGQGGTGPSSAGGASAASTGPAGTGQGQ